MPDDPETPPPVSVRLPPSLVKLFPGSKVEIALEASTVGELIDALDARWPGMRDRLCDSSSQIRRHINVFVAGKMASLETRLTPGAQVVVLPGVIR